jgi:hypothetical protein
VKKLLALLIVPGFLAVLSGCPSPTSNPAPTTTKTTDTKTTDTKTTDTKTTDTKTTKDDKDKPKTTEGKFGKYDKDKDKLTIKVGSKDEDFEVKGITPKVDGKDGKWDEIKDKADVTVTTEKDKVTKVEAKNPAAEAPKETKVEGKFVSEKEDKLTLMVGEDKKDFDVKGIKPKIDDKDGEWKDVKKDAKVILTEKDGKVTKAEAKNP